MNPNKNSDNFRHKSNRGNAGLRKPSNLLIKLGLGLILFGLSLFVQAQTPDFRELEKTIEVELAAAKTPGAAVAIVQNEKIIFAKGFGKTSVEDGANISADTLFRMGSTTKMFTAAALVNLAERGKIKLNAPISEYIKNLLPKVSGLTAHHILSQSSGLRDLPPSVFTNDDAGLRQNILAWKDDVFFTEPDKIYSYSSANYWLAGLLTEEIYDKPYADSISELILRPLGMTRSCVRPFEAMTFPLALGHDIKNGAATVIRPIDNNAAKFPGGSMYSNVNELSRFAIAMLNGGRIEGKQAIAQSVVENLTKPQFNLPGEDKSFYGYGLLGFTDRGVKTVSHGGVSRGYGSTIFFAPEQKIAIIVLANSNGQTLPKTRRKAMEMLLPLKEAANESPQTLSVSADELKHYVGKFSHAPQTWEVFAKNEKLYLKEDGKEFELKKIGKNEFSYEQGGIIFVSNEEGKIEHIFMGLYAAKRID